MAIERALNQQQGDRGEPDPQGPARPAVRHGEHRRPRPPHVEDLRHDRRRGRHQGHRADHRRERHGQVAGRPGHPSPQRAGATSRSSRSPAAPCRKRCWKASCSATWPGPSPAPSAKSSASSCRPTSGTIFLDEISTASPGMQVKLLRVLQDLEFEQVGGTKTFTVDTRVILATNDDLGRVVGRRPLPPGPLLSHQRDQHRAAAAARADLRHPAAGRAFPASRSARTRASSVTRLHRRGPGRLAALPLAGQRPRVAERDRAGRAVGQGDVIGVDDLPAGAGGRRPRDRRAGRRPHAQAGPGEPRAADHPRGARIQQLEPQRHGRGPGHQPHHALQEDERLGPGRAAVRGAIPLGERVRVRDAENGSSAADPLTTALSRRRGQQLP